MKKKTIGRYLKYRWIKYRKERKRVRFLNKQSRNLRKATREADRLHAATGKRYWVPEHSKPGAFVVVNNDELAAGKKAGLWNKALSIQHLFKDAPYRTK